MTSEFKYLLKLMAAGATNTPINTPFIPSIDYKKVMAISIQQSAFHLCYVGLKPIYKAMNIDEQTYNIWKMQVLHDVVSDLKRRTAVAKILRNVKKSGFSYALLKGDALSVCYAHPELRIALDTDILIDPKDEKEVLKYLEKFNIQTSLRHAGGHHTQSYSKEAGLIEIHIKPYEDIFDEIWFKELLQINIQDLELRYEVNPQTGEFLTLPYQESLYNVTFHFIKHFIVGTAHVRQILDILMFCKAYFTRIDWASFYQIIHKSGYNKLIDTIWYIGEHYFEISLQRNGYSSAFDHDQIKTLADNLLTDMENSIKYKSNKDYKNFWITYSKLKYKRSNKRSAFLYMMQWRLRRLHQVLFPPKTYLIKNCSLDKTSGVFNCWLRHIFLYVKRFKEKQPKDILLFTKDNSENAIAKEHIKLLEDLSIL